MQNYKITKQRKINVKLIVKVLPKQTEKQCKQKETIKKKKQVKITRDNKQ